MKRTLLALTALILLAISAVAQTTTAKVNIRGTVYDNAELQPMEGATVRLTTEEGKLVAGNATLKNGQFLLPNITTGTYKLSVKMTGFKEQTFTLTLPQKSGNFKVNDILLREETTILQEAVVVGKLPEMVVVDDTVMYNADAFKLPDGALVEELIKKFPGIEIDDNGNYLWNGKSISQILVDGKEFFGNNKNIVLKNLPAEIVDKVKVYDKKSDMARITGIDDGEEKTVLDLAIKKNRKRGWFGNLEGAYGTRDRYNGRAMVNRFVGDQKFSVVGNGNNTNGNGMTDNQDAGATMNWMNQKIELNGSLSGKFSQASSQSWNNSQSFENRKAAYSNSHNQNSSNNKSLNFNYKVEWKPDSLTNILFRPELSLSRQRSTSASESAAFSSDPYLFSSSPLDDYALLADTIGVNHRENANQNQSGNVDVKGSLQVNRRLLGKAGRNVTLNLDAGYSSSTTESSSFSLTNYYQQLATDGQDSTYHKVQYNDAPQRNKNVSARLSYSEPIGFGMFLQMSYQYTYRFSDRDRNVSSIFDWMSDAQGHLFQPFVQNAISRLNYRSWQSLSSPDVAQCNYTTNTYQNHNLRLQLRINRTKYQLTVGANVQPQINRVDYTKGLKHYDVGRTVVNASPTLNFRYKFSRNEQFDLRYNGNTGQPSITQLIPDTLSNADPLNISLGNPELKPSFTQRMEASYRRTNVDHQRTNALNFQFNTTQNATTNRTQYNETTGGRISMPVNINGNWNGSLSYNFNTALDQQKYWRVSTGTRSSLTNAVSYVYRSADSTTVKNRTRGLNVNQSLRLTYRRDWESLWGIEANVHASFAYNHSRSTNTSASNLDTRRFTYGSSFVLQFPWGMTLSSDINQQSRRGYTDASMNTNELIWNAQISQRLLPRKTLTLSLRAYDILNRRDDVNRNISATSRTDSRTENVRSYVLFTVNFRFGKFGGRGQRNQRTDGERPEGRPEGSPRGEGRGEGRGGNRGSGFGGPGGGGGFGGHGGGR